jgi:hypothetical protein
VETRELEIEAEPPVPDLPEVIIPSVAAIPAVVTQLLMFDISSEGLQQRKASHKSLTARATSNQLGLFGI